MSARARIRGARSRRRLAGSAACALTIATWLSVASGQSASDSDRAEHLFAEATTLVDRADYAAACPKFEESQRLDPALGTQFNVALCYRHLGRLGSAWRNFRAVERLAHSTGKTGREQAAHRELADLAARAPHFVFSVAEPDVTLSVDGERVDPADYPFYAVDPGDHAIAASASAKTPWRTTRTIPTTNDGSGSALAVSVPALATAAGATRVVTVTTDAPNAKRSAGLVALAVGGAGVVVGAVTGILVLNAKSTASDKCTPQCIDESGSNAVSRGKTLLSINTVSWIAGIAGLGAGATLLLLSRRPATSRATLAPSVAPHSAGLDLFAAF